jgi:hypothetical protein
MPFREVEEAYVADKSFAYQFVIIIFFIFFLSFTLAPTCVTSELVVIVILTGMGKSAISVVLKCVFRLHY